MLLKYSTCLLYTPHNEHFGIVPIEAMYMKCPVIAVASGGPLETVVDQQTGFLCEAEAEKFAEAMFEMCKDVQIAKRMGERGHEHVVEKFSFETFTRQLTEIVTVMIGSRVPY